MSCSLMVNVFMQNLRCVFPYAGNYKKCSSVAMETTTGNKYTCRSTCDVTATGTTELKVTSKTPASSSPAICDIKVLE